VAAPSLSQIRVSACSFGCREVQGSCGSCCDGVVASPVGAVVAGAVAALVRAKICDAAAVRRREGVVAAARWCASLLRGRCCHGEDGDALQWWRGN